MISSLFISVPLEFGYDAIMSGTARLPSWAMTVDSAKTSLPAPPRQGNGACENRPLLIPWLKSFRESERDIAHAFAIYSNCKSIVSSISRLHIRIFFREGERRIGAGGPLTPMRMPENSGETSGGDDRRSICYALHHSSE